MLNPNIPNGRKYDIIIFGATSFIGQCIVREVLKMLDPTGDDIDEIRISWAIAGRSLHKMEQLLLRIGRETKKDLLTQVDMIQADVFNPSTVLSMVKQCRVVLNCVGPYQLYGECVVKACVESGTHHLDLAEEPMFLGQMELKYSALAARSGSYIIGACGFDSIPSDCGALYLQQNFKGDVNSVESFVGFVSDNSKWASINSGTWKSAVWGAHYILNFILLKGELNRNFDPPSFKYKLPWWPVQYRKEVNSWCMIAPFPDGEVMERTQRYTLQNKENTTKPIMQTRCYLQFPGLLYMAIFLVCSFACTIIAQVKWGAKVLAKFPRLFTLGISSYQGASVEAMNQTEFTFTLVANGWADSSQPLDRNYRSSPNKTKILKVKGSKYGATAKIFLHAALTLLSEKDKLPKRGGVYSPGIAFANTNLVERLNRNGVTFALQNRI